MKHLSLLFLSLFACLAALGNTVPGAPSRVLGQDEPILGDLYFIYQRTNAGSAINPETHTSCVPQDGLFEIVREYDNNEVYIKNIVYGADREFGDYWVQGTYNDTTETIHVPMNQVIYEQNADGSFVRSGRRAILVWGTVSFDASTGNTTFVVNADTREATYTTQDGNTIHIEHTSGPIAINSDDDLSFNASGPAIVWLNEGDDTGEGYSWAGYCEWGTIIDTTPYVINEQPEGELKTYTRTSDCIHYTDYTHGKANPTFSSEKLSDTGEIVFGTDGKTVYLKDPFLSLKNNTWVKGRLTTDKKVIYVELPQYLYANDFGDYFAMSQANSKISSVALPNGEIVDALYVQERNEYHNIAFVIDGNTITLWDTNANFDAEYPNNYKARGIHVYDFVNKTGVLEANIVYTLNEDTPIEPTEKTIAPVISGNAVNNGHAYRVEITQSEPSAIYYCLLDGNRSATQWVPYDAPVIINTPGDYRIQAYAVATDKLPSDIVEHLFTVTPATGIDETTTGKQVASMRYFNAMGQELQQPEGVTIVVTTYSDGTSTAVKVVK